MISKEFESEIKLEISENLRQSNLSDSLSPGETVVEPDASSIEELKAELLETYFEGKTKEKKKLRVRLLIGFLLVFSLTTMAMILRFPYLISLGCLLPLIPHFKYAVSQQHDQTMKDLSRIEEMSHVGILCEILKNNTWSGEVECATKITLTKLLPNLKSSDFDLLDKKQRSTLREQFNEENISTDLEQIEFQIAVLKTYERIGSVDELQVVWKVCKSKNRTFAPSVREAAKSCLPFLQARVSDEMESHQLLRASSFTTLGTDELLRPAIGSEDPEPKTLLRASHEVERK